MTDKPGLAEAVERIIDHWQVIPSPVSMYGVSAMGRLIADADDALVAHRSRVPVLYDCRECNWIGCSGALDIEEAQEIHDENNADHSVKCRAAVRPLVEGEP